MTEIMPSLQNLIKLSYDSPGLRGFFTFDGFLIFSRPLRAIVERKGGMRSCQLKNGPPYR